MHRHSKDELLQCVLDCVSESLPADWEFAYMQASIHGDEIDATFRFGNKDGVHAFQPKRPFAPLNAARELQRLMKGEGQTWESIKIEISPDGSYEIETHAAQ